MVRRVWWGVEVVWVRAGKRIYRGEQVASVFSAEVLGVGVDFCVCL